MSFEEPDPFVPIRLHLQIQPGTYACIKHRKSSGVLASYRSGTPGQGGGGWGELSDVKMPYSEEMVVLITAVKPDQSLTLKVVDVSGDDDCEVEDEPTSTGPGGIDCLSAK